MLSPLRVHLLPRETGGVVSRRPPPRTTCWGLLFNSGHTLLTAFRPGGGVSRPRILPDRRLGLGEGVGLCVAKIN